jgi:hypothetical protein
VANVGHCSRAAAIPDYLLLNLVFVFDKFPIPLTTAKSNCRFFEEKAMRYELFGAFSALFYLH